MAAVTVRLGAKATEASPLTPDSSSSPKSRSLASRSITAFSNFGVQYNYNAIAWAKLWIEALYGDPAMLALIGRSSSAFRAHVLGGAELPGLFAELRDDMGAAVERGLLPAFDVELMTAAMIGAALEVCILAAASGRAPAEVATFLGQLFLAALRP